LEVLNASQNENKPTCPYCGSSKVKSNGNKKKKDGTMILGEDGKPKKRFKCLNSECGKGF
jgi:transposase-like protein